MFMFWDNSPSLDFIVGAKLHQRIDMKPIAIYFANKTLGEAEVNYTTPKKEWLTIVLSLKFFYSYLLCNKIIIVTDHATF